MITCSQPNGLNFNTAGKKIKVRTLESDGKTEFMYPLPTACCRQSICRLRKCDRVSVSMWRRDGEQLNMGGGAVDGSWWNDSQKKIMTIWY